MDLMDRDTEQRLYTALNAMIKDVNGGTTPTDALVKVARDHGLNDPMTRLLGQSFNASRSIAHQQAFSGQDRCQHFSLANPDEAINTVFNSTKTAGERLTAAQLRIHDHLTEPGRRVNFFDRALKLAREHEPAATTEKTASVVSTEVSEPTMAERYVDRQVKLASVRQAERDSLTAEHAEMAALQEATEAVRDHLHVMPFDVVEQGLVARYGQDQGTKLAAVLFSNLNGSRLRQKRATSFERSVFDYNLNPFATIDRFVLSAISAANSQAKLAAAREAAAADPFVESQPSSNEAVGLLPWDRAKIASSFMPETSSVLGLIGDNRQPPVNSDKEFETALDREAGGGARTQLRNIRVQAMLKELMAADPVIATYDPTEVVDRYNEVVNVAPHLADKPLAIRGILRRSLQQGTVDPFEVGQYLSMNEAQRKQGEPLNDGLQSAATTADVLRKGNMAYQRAKDTRDENYRQAMLGTKTPGKPVDDSPKPPATSGAQPPPLPPALPQLGSAKADEVVDVETVPETRSTVDPASVLVVQPTGAALPSRMRRPGT